MRTVGDFVVQARCGRVVSLSLSLYNMCVDEGIKTFPMTRVVQGRAHAPLVIYHPEQDISIIIYIIWHV